MINVNKLFRRLSIRTKLVIAFVALGVVPVGVGGGYGAAFSFALLNRTVLDSLQQGVSLKAGEVTQFLEGVRDDVALLARMPGLRALLDAPPGAQAVLTIPVQEAFLAFSQSRKAYYQVRYLDERGREVVRVDFDGERHRSVPPAELQDKADRYYFREAMRTPADGIYVSPMDLNEEWGRVESPPKAVVRYAARVESSRGAPRGIVIVNLYAAKILSQVVSLGRQRGAVLLMDGRGAYLADSRQGRAETGPFVATAGLDVRRDFPPDLARRIVEGIPGAAAEAGAHGRIVAFAPIRPGSGSDPWIVAHVHSKAEALASIRSLQLLVLGLAGAVLVVALLLGVAAARHFTRPITALIRGAEAVAAGTFDRPIRVETNDELEDLGRQFNRMAEDLARHEGALLAAREDAERRAREAEALSRIGIEISRPLPLPHILQLVVEKAKQLSGADLAILCLAGTPTGLTLGAVSEPAGAIVHRPGDSLGARTCRRMDCEGAACPVTAGVGSPTQVAVPLRTGERAVGYLCVGYPGARAVGPDERRFLERLANQAAIAIENARLTGEVRDLATLEERQRIALDLHDGIIQSIYATGLGLEECVRIAEVEPWEVKPRLEQAIDNLNAVIGSVRNYIVGLGPEELERRGLARALGDLVQGLALNGLPAPDLSVDDGIDAALSAEQTAHLFHICQEALTNVVKHARASRVAIALRREDGRVVLTVADDGIGLEGPGPAATGRGLRNMAERARRGGGELLFARPAGGGTQVAVSLPLGAQS
jgi:signal transduction histidine kinase